MVCSTRLILEQAGADLLLLLLSIPGAVVSTWRRKEGGGGLFCLGEHLHRLRGPTSSPPPLHYASTNGVATENAL